MTNIEKIKEYIKQKCVEAQPNKEWEYTTECSCQSREDIYVIVQIQLSDILLAIRKKHKEDKDFADELQDFKELFGYGSNINYDLSKHFTEQSEEVIEFLAKLLGYTKEN